MFMKKNRPLIKKSLASTILIGLILACSLIMVQAVQAGSATVSWNANTESDLSGYKIYYGTTSRTGTDPKSCGMCGYATKIDVGNVTSYTINNLTNNQTYYFSTTAYDTTLNESVFSTEVNKLVTGTTATADLNSDGLVNSVDAGIMMSSWGSTTKPKADINQDSIVNSVDAGIMMSQWTK